MENLNLNKKDAIATYPNSSVEDKKLLEEIFGKEALISASKEKENIHSLQDACMANGVDIDNIIPFKNPKNDDERCVNAFASFIQITRAFNERKKRDWYNSSQYKYYAWWNMNDRASGSGLSFLDTDCVYSGTCVASRLTLLNSGHVKLLADRFPKLYEDLMIEK